MNPRDKRVLWDAERIFSLDFQPQCYNLTPQQIEALMAIFPQINWNARWENANSYSRDDRMKFAAELMYQLMNPVDCGVPEENNSCIEYPPFSERIEWFPVSPYSDQNERENFWNLPIWLVVNLTLEGFLGDILSAISGFLGLETILNELLGIENGDVITTLPNLLLQPDLGLLFSPPGFKFTVQGPATVELHLVSVPMGGRAYIGLDQDPFELNSFDDIIEILDSFLDPNDSVIDLDIDLISIPPEFTSGATIHEIEITDSESHTIFVRYLPVLDDSVSSFARFGGGLRKIVICGPEATMPSVDCEFVQNCYENNQDNVAMQDIIIVNMQQTTEQFLQDLEDLYVDSPDDINPLIPAIAPDAAERNALCHAIGAWLRLYCEAKKTAIRQSSFLSQAWNSLQNAIVDAYGLLNNVVGFIVPDNLFSCFVSSSEALTALSDETLIDALICCLYDELDGITLLQGSLAGALAACSGNDLVCLIQNDMNLQHELNFFYIYGRTLERQNSGEIFDCPCEEFGQMYIEYDFTVSNHGFTSANGTWQAGIGWVGNVSSSGGDYTASLTITKQYTGSLPIGWAGGMVYNALSNCGIEQHGWAISKDAVNVGFGQIGGINNGDGNHITWNRSTAVPYAPVEYDTVAFYGTAKCCGCGEGKMIITKAREWIDDSSPVRGIPSDTYPQGLGANGSSSVTFWE